VQDQVERPGLAIRFKNAAKIVNASSAAKVLRELPKMMY
jgi:hypothetical protein